MNDILRGIRDGLMIALLFILILFSVLTIKVINGQGIAWVYDGTPHVLSGVDNTKFRVKVTVKPKEGSPMTFTLVQ